MPTRTEAGEALFRAVRDYQEAPTSSCVIHRGQNLAKAVRDYRNATPDPLPAEVQRVVEAADRYERLWTTLQTEGPVVLGLAPALDALLAATRAYRSTQPEPLSARLARLKAGSVVEGVGGKQATVIGNDPETQELWVRHYCPGFGNFAVKYATVTAIISEVA